MLFRSIEAFLMLVLDGMLEGRADEEVVASLSEDQRFAFFATPAPQRGDGEGERRFSRSVKSAAFVSELLTGGVRCRICDALLHRNSMQTDHKVRREDGGGAGLQNAQVSHPFCNTTYKERRHAAGSDV